MDANCEWLRRWLFGERPEPTVPYFWLGDEAPYASYQT